MAGKATSCMQGLSAVQSDLEPVISITFHPWWQFYQNTSLLIGQSTQNASAQVIGGFIDFAFEGNAN